MRTMAAALLCTFLCGCHHAAEVSSLKGIPVLLGPKERIGAGEAPPAGRRVRHVAVALQGKGPRWEDALPAAVALPDQANSEERAWSLHLTRVEAEAHFVWFCCEFILIPIPVFEVGSSVALEGDLFAPQPGAPPP